MNLTQQLLQWQEQWSKEAERCDWQYKRRERYDEQAAQLHGYSTALDVAARGIPYIQEKQFSEAELVPALEAYIKELQVCIDLNNKHYIVTPPPWITPKRRVQAEATVSKYQEIIKQIEEALKPQEGLGRAPLKDIVGELSSVRRLVAEQPPPAWRNERWV